MRFTFEPEEKHPRAAATYIEKEKIGGNQIGDHIGVLKEGAFDG